jgi:hypothetical protein
MRADDGDMRVPPLSPPAYRRRACAFAQPVGSCGLRLLFLDIFQTDSAPGTQAGARLLDPAQKARIVFEPIIPRNLLHGGFANCARHESVFRYRSAWGGSS